MSGLHPFAIAFIYLFASVSILLLVTVGDPILLFHAGLFYGMIVVPMIVLPAFILHAHIARGIYGRGAAITGALACIGVGWLTLELLDFVKHIL